MQHWDYEERPYVRWTGLSSPEHRIDFKNLLFVFKALRGPAPGHISKLFILLSTSRPPMLLLSIPSTQLKSKDVFNVTFYLLEDFPTHAYIILHQYFFISLPFIFYDVVCEPSGWCVNLKLCNQYLLKVKLTVEILLVFKLALLFCLLSSTMFPAQLIANVNKIKNAPTKQQSDRLLAIALA